MTLAQVRSKTERIREFSALPFLLVAGISTAGAFFRAAPQAVTGGPLVAGDVAWMLTATGLVLLMTPGLSFFYGGMVRTKNVVSTMLQSFVAMGVISMLWILVGFSLAFGDSIRGVIGNPLTFFMFTRVGAQTHPDLAPTIPLILFALFQLKFAIITPALITGSFAERVRFTSYLLFMCLFSIFVYSPLAHWTWHPDGLPAQAGRSRFRGRHRGPHVSRLRRAGRCDGAWTPADASGRRSTYARQHSLRHSGNRDALVRLVRLQRRLGVVGVGPGGHGVRDDQYGVSRRGAGVDALRRHARAKAVGTRRLRRRGRGARGHYTGRGLRQHRRDRRTGRKAT